MRKIFEYYIESESLHFKYAKGAPTVRDREFHGYHEFVLFMEGEASLISKNIQQALPAGSLILIPKEHFHQFLVTHPERYTRCILRFDENEKNASLVRLVMNTVKVLEAPEERAISVFQTLIEFAKSDLPEEEKALLLEGAVVQLLLCHKKNSAPVVDKNSSLSEPVARALDIIDEKFRAPLSVGSIAQMLYISPSTLAHKFASELNISVYGYIIKKRLAAARELIASGEPMTSAAIKCGFGDYSCFYRLYKKYR